MTRNENGAFCARSFFKRWGSRQLEVLGISLLQHTMGVDTGSALPHTFALAFNLSMESESWSEIQPNNRLTDGLVGNYGSSREAK